MSLIVEDGTGKVDAESYSSVAYADAYHLARGNAAWADVANKEAALRNATDYMEQSWRDYWGGIRQTETQALSWPRYDVWLLNEARYVPMYTLPKEVQNACAVLALKAATTELAPDLGPQVIEKTIGPISKKFAPGTRQTTKFNAVEMMLRPFFSSGGNTIRLVRG